MQSVKVPLNDIKRQTATFDGEIESCLREVVSSGWYVLGPNVKAFEAEFAAYNGARHCIAAANGTDALELSLRALGCGPGSEVVTVANAGMYATSAILAVGAQPVFADVDVKLMTLAPAALERCIGINTRAVVVTHLYGQLADIAAIAAITSRLGIPLIEDCAQAHGAERDGKRAGTFGTIGTFSFYPTKNLGALGDGGALLTDDDGLAERLRSLRQYGWSSKYRAETAFGRNSRLDELQAAILRLKLPRLDGWNQRRRSIVQRYRAVSAPGVLVSETSGLDHVAHLCVVRTSRRDALQDALNRNGIATEVHYPVPDHRQAALRGIVADVSLPATEACAGEILTLPSFPEMTDQEVERVCDSLRQFSAGSRAP